MRTLLFFAFVSFAVPVFCQNADSLAIVREVDSLLTTATGLWRAGKNQEALPIARQAADLSKQKWGENNARHAASLHRLAGVLFNLGQHKEAEELYLKTIDLRARLLGKEHVDYARSLSNLGLLYYLTGDFAKAEPVYLEATDVLGKVFGKEHADYTTCLNSLVVLYLHMGNFEKAEPLCLEIKNIREKTLGREHPDYAANLANLALVYASMGNYKKAEPVCREALNLCEKTQGKEHPEYARNLYNLLVIYIQLDNYEKAEPLCLELIAIRERSLGKEHPDYIDILNKLASLYWGMGNYEKAEPLLLESKTVSEKVLGNTHPDYAASLNSLANLYNRLGKFEKAEPLYLEALTIRRNALGKEHPDYAASLSDLASLYHAFDFFEKAEPLYLEAKTIREKNPGKAHPHYAISLNNLAAFYVALARYEKAEPLYLEAITIREKELGKEHPKYASSLNNLASLYSAMGWYEKAEPLQIEAKAIWEKALGKEHSDYAVCLANLGILYYHTGNYKKAEAIYLEAKVLREKSLGKEHPDYVSSLYNLVVLYMAMGNYEKAEPLIIESKAIYEKSLGKEHPEYAGILNYLALLCKKTGNYEKAEAVYLESKAIYEKILGKEHPKYASSLNDLASLYRDLGNFEKAEPIYLEAKAIWKKSLGNEHPEYAKALNNLAFLYENKNRFPASDLLLTELSALEQARLSKAASFLSELELTNYTATFQSTGDDLASYLLARPSGLPGVLPAMAYDHALFFKGFLLTAAEGLNTRSTAAPASEEINLRLKSYRRRLAAEYAKPVAERKGVAELEEKANSTEKELARTVTGYADAIRQVKWQEVQRVLKRDEMALELVHFQVNFPKNTDSTLYAALLLLPGAEQPTFIPLFEEKSLDSILQTQGERKADYVNGIYALAERGAKPLGKPQKTLYDLLWKPLEPHLQGVQTIYFSPSGLLHRLNLAAIPISMDSMLGDRYHLVELGSTRQLVVPSVGSPARKIANTAVLFGGITYDADTTAMSQANAGLDSISITSRGELSFSYTDSTLRVGTWRTLPFTDREVKSVEKTLNSAGFQIETRRSFAATEEAFKSIGAGDKPSPRVLHLATHGFFFPDPKNSPSPLERGLGGEAEPVFKRSDHPMIRSGLLLAGANYAWATGKSLRPGMEDGILTAYEISQMNLSNTELVVLSACETGLGDIQGNEGVYGLQRAFKIAGAKYLIMSLWQVPDQETSVFMSVFYKHWLEGKKDIPEAFRTTQQEMRERFINPYQWAGFVLVE